jgi:preprotein translocase subunit SecE
VVNVEAFLGFPIWMSLSFVIVVTAILIVFYFVADYIEDVLLE